MNRFALVAAVAAVPLFSAPALAETNVPPAISVTGEASISAPPDLAQLDAGVASDGKTAREASEANNTAMAKVLAALKGTGIDEKDVVGQHPSAPDTSELRAQTKLASS